MGYPKSKYDFKVGQVVQVDDKMVDGTTEKDFFLIVGRYIDKDDNTQYYNLKRRSDKAIWVDVPACSIINI